MTKTLVADVETNGLTGYTKMWCAVTYCLEKKELKVFRYDEENYIEDFRNYIQDATGWIGHNFIAFDRDVISHFTGLPQIPCERIVDTLVRSRLFNSGRDGGHSLERWGSYFHVSKIAYSEWERFDPRIVERCIKDVAITLKLYNQLEKEGKNVSSFAIKREEKFQELLTNMKKQGFPVIVEGIEKELGLATAERLQLETDIRKAFPPRAKKIADVIPKYTKDGQVSKSTKGARVVGAANIGGPFTLVDWVPFNIGSPKQVVERLNEYGWKPVEFTKGGENGDNPQPKVSQANLDTLPDDAPKEAKLITSFLKLDTRIGLMENWLANYNKNTGKIHGDMLHIGTITHRCSHQNPNTGNIPNANGGEIRAYWGLPSTSNYRLVGVDAKGIQLRILDHLTKQFTKDDTFTQQVLYGDPHTNFTLPIVAEIYPEAVAYKTEEEKKEVKNLKTKRFIYAFLLGAGDLKTGTIFGLGREEGKNIRNAFTSRFPGLPELRDYLSRCSKNGWFPSPSGCFIPIKSEHYALSVALQGIESEVMKLAGILWEKERNKNKLDAWLIGFVHDEYVIQAHKDCAQQAGELMMGCIAEAGRILKLNTPMEGDMKIGFNWHEVH